jgi:hypothetical protein
MHKPEACSDQEKSRSAAGAVFVLLVANVVLMSVWNLSNRPDFRNLHGFYPLLFALVNGGTAAFVATVGLNRRRASLSYSWGIFVIALVFAGKAIVFLSMLVG